MDVAVLVVDATLGKTSVDEELLNVIELIAVILGGLTGEDEDGK